jgi:EAL domain-containing protein (putative c-di-GMP-specific phosphodiesterase class I)
VLKKIESIEVFTKDALVRTSVSIGLTSVEQYETDTFTSLMSVADTACHLAKSEGKNTLHVIEATGTEFKDHLKNVKWIDEIEQAISNKRLLLYAQNIEDLRAQSQHYCEVLIRLKQQNGNIVSPSAFIPQAERFRVMPLVDRHVFESLVRNMVDNITYSVNLSGQTISDKSFVAFVERIMDTYVFDPKNITFEITETTAMMSIDDTVKNIKALRKKGFSFSLDDFGTGLASFNYLKSLPVDTVKIDGLFIRDISSNRTSGQIVKSICDVAHSMGLKTVAEYVTDETTYNEVKNLDVDYAQGYFIHEPELLGIVHGNYDPDIAQAS